MSNGNAYGHDKHASQKVHVEDVQQNINQDVVQSAAAAQNVTGNLSIELGGKFLPHSEVNITIDESYFSS